MSWFVNFIKREVEQSLPLMLFLWLIIPIDTMATGSRMLVFGTKY